MYLQTTDKAVLGIPCLQVNLLHHVCKQVSPRKENTALKDFYFLSIFMVQTKSFLENFLNKEQKLNNANFGKFFSTLHRNLLFVTQMMIVHTYMYTCNVRT